MLYVPRQHCNFVYLTDIRIGFAQELYEYFEPCSATLFTNIALGKDNNRASEQTFRIHINISDPTTVRPAALQTVESGPNWDYSFSAVGQTFILSDISPLQQSVLLPVFLNGDEITEASEGSEGFQLTATTVESRGFAPFLPPLPISTTAFQSTTVIITGKC